MDKITKKAFRDLKYMIKSLEDEYLEEESEIEKNLILSPQDVRMLYTAQECIAVLHYNLQYYRTLRKTDIAERNRMMEAIQKEQEAVEKEDKKEENLLYR